MITLPEGWTQRGELPSMEFADAGDVDRELFDEDILQITDPTGQYVLDLGWYPAEAPDGQFRCRLISSDNWNEPEEELATRSLRSAREWIEVTATAVRDSVGERAEFSDDLFVTLSVLAVRLRPGMSKTKAPPPVVPIDTAAIRANEHITGRARPPKAIPPEMFESREHAT